jgi:hypothetical protein
LRAHHDDHAAFRAALLDLLFATGCAVGESAVALEAGDASVVRASGPAAPALRPPLVLVALDATPPHLASVGEAVGPARWPSALAGLGGPAVAVAWVAAVQALCQPSVRRPWRALYLRGPADGLAAFAASELAELEADAEVIQLATTGAEPDPPAALALGWLELQRPRNVWRLPACDHSYALAGRLPWPGALDALDALLVQLDRTLDWTLHDVHLYFGAEVQLTAVLRTSADLAPLPPAFQVRAVPDNQRLMFPVNDALAALRGLPERLPAAWAEALRRPLHLCALPDGLRLGFLVPSALAEADAVDALPERVGPLAASWRAEPLVAPPPAAAVRLALGAEERPGALVDGVHAASRVVWLVPRAPEDVDGLARALATQVEALGQLR